MKVYDLGVGQLGQRPETLKVLAWPVNAWTCYVPENLVPPLNIFEKLILSLIQKEIIKNQSDLKYILSEQVGLNKELVENVVDECCKKYTDQRRKDLKLNADAEKNLEAMVDGISLEMEMSDTMKKVYLFQDLVTNTVIPCFNIEKLPADYEAKKIDDENCVTIEYNDISTQPKTSSISNALYYWTKIQKDIRNNEASQDNSIEIEQVPNEAEENLEEDLFEIEETKTLADNEKQERNLKSITIYDDEPTKLILKGYLAFNPNNPEDVEVISPFGNNFNNWFKKIINRVRVTYPSFNEELQLFLMLKKEENMDKIAFDNNLNVRLFEDFPIISNDAKYRKLKKAIEDLTKDYQRIFQGEDETTNFVKNLRTAIEVVFREVVKINKEIYNLKYDYVYDQHNYESKLRKYKQEISQIVDAQRLDEEIKKRFHNKGIFLNIANTRGGPEKGNPKDCAALILLYANRYRESAAMEFVKSYQHIFIDLFTLVGLGTDAGHAGGNYVNMSFTPDKVEKYYSDYENIVRAIFPLLIEGEKDG